MTLCSKRGSGRRPGQLGRPAAAQADDYLAQGMPARKAMPAVVVCSAGRDPASRETRRDEARPRGSRNQEKRRGPIRGYGVTV
jgi:hypothetical protein